MGSAFGLRGNWWTEGRGKWRRDCLTNNRQINE